MISSMNNKLTNADIENLINSLQSNPGVETSLGAIGYMSESELNHWIFEPNEGNYNNNSLNSKDDFFEGIDI